MRMRTSTYGEVKLTVHRATIDDHYLVRNRIAVALAPFVEGNDLLDRLAWVFADVISQTDVLEGANWQLPPSTATAQELWDSFTAWRKLDGSLLNHWRTEIEAVNAPPGDPKYLPPDHLTQEQLADPNGRPPEKTGGKK